MPNIKLRSSDGDVFEVDVDIAKQSVVVKTMLEEPMPLTNVKSAILKKVIQWCTYHKNVPSPAEDDKNKEKRTDDICSWDTKFLKVDQGTLFELILAANYLDIKGLLDVTCKTVANMIKGKTSEEIRKTFNIKNDCTLAEEELQSSLLFAAATTMSEKQTSQDDEQMETDLASAFQNKDQASCAKFTLPTAAALQDLPMELQERILMEVIVSEVRDRKLLRSAWKELADRTADRLRNVCPQWDSLLTNDAFQKRLHGILDSFLLPQKLARIDIYAHNDLKTVKRKIKLPDITMPWKLVACSMKNALYVLHQVSSSIEIWRVVIDEREFQVSPWIKCSSKLISRMSVAADGRVILFQGPYPSTIKVYDADGALRHQVELQNHNSYLFDVVSKSNGNFVLVKKRSLVEVDRKGNTLREYKEPSGEFIYCTVDLLDRIVMIDDGGHVRLVDAEFNSVAVKFVLESYERSMKHFYHVHYNKKRNEFVAFECAAFSGPGARQCLTVFNFTERSIPNDAQNKPSSDVNSDFWKIATGLKSSPSTNFCCLQPRVFCSDEEKQRLQKFKDMTKDESISIRDTYQGFSEELSKMSNGTLINLIKFFGSQPDEQTSAGNERTIPIPCVSLGDFAEILSDLMDASKKKK